jgi:hypothetical protein
MYILLGVVFVLVVAEVGWIFAFNSNGSVVAEEEEELIIAPFFVQMDSIVIPVIRNDQVERHVMLTLVLEVGDNHSRRRVYKATHLIRDAFVLDLHGYMRVILSRSRDKFMGLLKGRLLRVVAGVVGPNVVRAVLVQQVAEREVH